MVAMEMTWNFYKYNTALYKIFINSPLVQCAVSLKCLFIWTRLLVVAYESLKTKGKASWVIPIVAMVTFRSSRLQKLFITKFWQGFSKVVVTRAGRLRECLQGELLVYYFYYYYYYYYYC